MAVAMVDHLAESSRMIILSAARTPACVTVTTRLLIAPEFQQSFFLHIVCRRYGFVGWNPRLPHN